MEHLHGVVLETSAHAKDLVERSSALARQSNADRARGPRSPLADLPAFIRLWIDAALSYDAHAATRVFDVLKKNRTWQTPTLVTMRDWAHHDDRTYLSDPRYRYLPEDPQPFIHTLLQSGEMSTFKKAFEAEVELVGKMHRAGLGLLAGTDGPPFWLADELELFVKAGLTPAEALRTATLNPAVFLNRTSEFGSIAKGNAADLVLLDEDPLRDIAAVRKVNAVVFGGGYFGRSELDSMLVDLAKRAAAAKVKR